MKNFDWNNLSEIERKRILKRPVQENSASLSESVREIITQVRKNGDRAVLECTRKYDQVELPALRVSAEEMERAKTLVPAHVLKAIDEAALRLEKFHLAQKPGSISMEVSKGIQCERRYLPISSVGLYVPGGTAPLPSTVMMIAIPARIAGCTRKILATPPQKDGSVNPAILVAAERAGISEIYKMGGAQAVAAMAFGTESVGKVDKIFGPGNSWVTEAKIQVSMDPDGAAFDLPAGPSEVLVIADQNAHPAFVASDLLSQAEHGVDSQVVLVTTSKTFLSKLAHELERQLSALPRATIARESLKKSFSILVENLTEAVEVSNRYAPEHLIIQTENPSQCVSGITNAGSVFLGPWSPESVGDYASGTNHVLPTYGFAKAYGGLTVESFMKSMTIQELSKEGLLNLAPVVETLAEVEGLDAHKRAVSIRVKEAIK